MQPIALPPWGRASGLIESEVPQLPVPMSEVDVIPKIGANGEASCRGMMEILTLLRQRASASMPAAA